MDEYCATVVQAGSVVVHGGLQECVSWSITSAMNGERGEGTDNRSRWVGLRSQDRFQLLLDMYPPSCRA
jgi:hypothetical protein